MSMLQRIEETYLGMLRFIIILGSSVLLIAAIVLGLSAASGLNGSSIPEKLDTSVKPDEVLTKISEERPSPTADAPHAKQAGEKSKGLASDPNQAFYDRTATAVVKFVDKYAKGIETVEHQNVVEVSRKKAENFSDPVLITAYASGLADLVERALADPELAKRIAKPAQPVPTQAPQATQAEEEAPLSPPSAEVPFKESPLAIVNQLLSTYTQLFVEKQSKKLENKAKAEAEELERKATAMTQLYFAGGTFASFLFLVFISIVVKIERNLRNLTPPVGQSQPQEDQLPTSLK